VLEPIRTKAEGKGRVKNRETVFLPAPRIIKEQDDEEPGRYQESRLRSGAQWRATSIRRTTSRCEPQLRLVDSSYVHLSRATLRRVRMVCDPIVNALHSCGPDFSIEQTKSPAGQLSRATRPNMASAGGSVLDRHLRRPIGDSDCSRCKNTLDRLGFRLGQQLFAP